MAEEKDGLSAPRLVRLTCQYGRPTRAKTKKGPDPFLLILAREPEFPGETHRLTALNKEERNIADVRFIWAEVERFTLMPPQEVIARIRDNPGDAFAHLSRSRGGILLCGRSAYDRFEELADRTINAGSAEAKYFYRPDYVHALRRAFVELFVDGGKPVNQSSVTKLINRAKQLASESLVEFTHHIPCALFYEKEPSKFAVGPVTFARVERFLDEIGDALNHYHQLHLDRFATGLRERKASLPSEELLMEAKLLADRHVANIREYYRRYNWIASVTIPACHQTLSKRRAERTVDAALDVLRLFITSIPQRYRRATAPNTPFETRELVTDSSGKMHVTIRKEGQGAPAGEGWHAGILRQAVRLWELCAEAIEPLRADETTDELNQRFLDALTWFGQAVVEQNPGAKIVKYTAALERLTMTGHLDSGIEAVVIKRVMMLNQDREDKTRAQIQKDLGRLYQCRSDLMHGSLSPYDASVTKVLRIAWEGTRWSILTAVQIFALLRQNGKANRKALAAVYDGGRRERSRPETG